MRRENDSHYVGLTRSAHNDYWDWGSFKIQVCVVSFAVGLDVQNQQNAQRMHT